MQLVNTKPLRGWRFALFNWVLGLGHVLVLFNAGIYVSSVVHVAGAFAVAPSFASWGQTDFMLALSLAFPIASWFARRLGEIRVVVLAYLCFALAAMICGSTDDFYVFLAARVALGFSGGLTIPLSQALIVKEYPRRSRVLGISVWSLFTLTPAALGPPLGGWIADNLGWRWLFHIDVPVALAVAGLTGALLYGRGSLRTTWTFDTVGGFLLAIVAMGFQTILNQGTDYDWFNSLFLVCIGIVGFCALLYLIVWELDTPYPAVDLRLFGDRNFTIGIAGLTLGFLYFQGLLTFFVVKSQTVLGYPALAAGLAYLPMIVFLKPTAFFFHEFAKKFDARLLASLSLLGFAATYFWISQFDRYESFVQIYGAHVLEGLCLGSFFVPLTVIMLSGIPPRRHARAVELAVFLRIAAGGVGISVQSILFECRVPFHQSRFVEHLTLFDPVTTETLDKFVAAGYTEQAAAAKLARLVTQHAAILSINDVYYVACILCIGLASLVWLADPAKLPARPSRRQEVRELAEEELVEEP
jgi:MFS transporter, DHA2 family, multidrug resistance protein